MASFQKPQLLKAALKLGLYGPAGSGKSFTALFLAEGWWAGSSGWSNKRSCP